MNEEMFCVVFVALHAAAVLAGALVAMRAMGQRAG